MAAFRTTPLDAKFTWWKGGAAVALGRKIYAVRRHELCSFDPRAGRLEKLGRDRWHTLHLIAVADHLCAIERDGGMYWVDPADASWREMDGDWRKAKAAVGLDGILYVSDGGGYLYEVIPGEGGWRMLRCGAGWSTRFLLGAAGRLCAVEENGAAFIVDPRAERVEQLGGDWRGALGGVGLDGAFYLVSAEGKMAMLEAGSSVWEPCCEKHDWRATRGLFAVDGVVCVVARDGSAVWLERQGMTAASRS